MLFDLLMTIGKTKMIVQKRALPVQISFSKNAFLSVEYITGCRGMDLNLRNFYFFYIQFLFSIKGSMSGSEKNRFSPVEYINRCRGRDLNPRPPDILALASKRTFELSL
jgi:hypothetical protein